MKQIALLPKTKRRTEHGGSLLLGKRRTKRPLSLKSPHHLVLRSDFAYGRRALTRHRPLIHRVIRKAQKRFDIKVHEIGIEFNHIHLDARGRTRSGLQNFFRVVAGHIAQEILREVPIKPGEKSRGGVHHPSAGGAPQVKREKENKFWQTRIYTRIVSWGRDWLAVKAYIIQNRLEGLGLVPYQPRKKWREVTDSS